MNTHICRLAEECQAGSADEPPLEPYCQHSIPHDPEGVLISCLNLGECIYTRAIQSPGTTCRRIDEMH
jgi:hypothetical protein